MSIEESLADLYRFIDAGRGRETTTSLVSSWLRTRIERVEHGAITADLLYALVDKRFNWENGENYTPKALAVFFGRLASLYPADSVLDPTCGFGLLLHDVALATDAKVVHGIDINAACHVLAQALLGERATIFNGETLTFAVGLQEKYDLIVADPPFGMRMRGNPNLPHLGDHFRGELGHALAVWACARLSDSGRAMLVLTPSFLWGPHAREVHAAIQALGCRVRALIHLPGGSRPHTGIETYIAVFERGDQQDVFVGEFADNPEHQERLISNLKRRKAGEHPALGRLCALSDFRGFDAFVAQERLKRIAKATGWKQHTADSVIVRKQRLTSVAGDIKPGADSLFLRLTGRALAVIDPTELPGSSLRGCVQMNINPELADARYMVHWFNQSLIGQATLAAVSQGSTLARIDLTALMNSNLYLPPLTEQRQVLQGIDHLKRIRAEAAELEAALWGGTAKTDVVVHQIGTINQEDRYEDWIETLPFPLASILWRHRAGGGSTREQYEVLLHFFEATAAFVATIHLSAFMADDDLWSDAGQGLHERLAKQNLSMDRATFGAWKLTVEYLAGKCRKLLSTDAGIETCRRIYGTPNQSHIEMICHSELLKTLQTANHIRNQWSGHAGATGPEEAQVVHDQLLNLVHSIRGVFGRSWLDYELIQPSEGRYQAGIHRYKAKRLVGTRSAPFEVVERESSQPMESDRLYLFDGMSQRGLLLRPFVRVMPSPERKANACFIFSRHEPGGSHFVSYHFEQESSLTATFPEVDEALRRIHEFDDRARP